jgi:hypothetical protein
VHYSFLSSGDVIGCYGRAVCSSLPENFGADNHCFSGDAATHQHQPKRQHRIIGRQRLRQLILQRLLPYTVIAYGRFAFPMITFASGKMGRVCLQL